MIDALEISRKIQVKNSPIEGYGVFATEDINEGEILEETPFILMPKYTTLGRSFHEFSKSVGYCTSKNNFYDSLRQNLGFKEPEKYYFTWTPPHPDIDGEQVSFQVLPLGLACIYNSSNTANNAGWKVNKKTFTFFTTKNIKAGEEIRTFYGYFVDDASRNWNSDVVFYFGVDNFIHVDAKTTGGEPLSDGGSKTYPCLSAIKFNKSEAFENSKKDPGYFKLISLVDKYKNLKFESISAISPFGQEGLLKSDMNKVKSSREIYEILHGYKTSNASKIKFIFSNFVNEERDEVIISR